MNSQRLIGSQIRKYYKEFLKFEKLSSEEIECYQKKKLSDLINYISVNVPFYNGDPLRELNDLPVMTKEIITASYKELMDPELKNEFTTGIKKHRYDWKEIKTGGSTGTPVAVIQSREMRDRGRASRMYSQYLCQFPFGTPYIRLWGSMREIDNIKALLPNRIINGLSREILLNAFQLSEKKILDYINVINDSNVDHIMAYVDAIYQLAKYAKEHNIKMKKISSVMGCAGTVLEHHKEMISEVFEAKLYNKYGSRECADIACECEKGGIHIYANNMYVETVDAEGKQVGPGKQGRILITILSNKIFPIVRYDIGDVGIISDKKCSCGMQTPLFEKIEGRVSEFLSTTDGSYVSPAFIIHLIGVVHNKGFVRKFQIIQNAQNKYTLLVECSYTPSDAIYNEFISGTVTDLKKVLGKDAFIDVEKRDQIPLTASGKFLYCINKIASFK